MKAHQHTPGEWIVDDRHIHCATGLTYPADSPVNRNVLLETTVILEVDTSCHPNGLLTETDKANLKLAAASPKLLAALTGLVRVMAVYHAKDCRCQCCRSMHAAIAAALP